MRWKSAGAASAANWIGGKWRWWRQRSSDRGEGVDRSRPQFDAETIRYLEVVAKSKVSTLRFPAALEGEFALFQRESTQSARFFILVMTLVLFLSTPAWSPVLLDLPQQSLNFTAMLSLFAVAPIFALATAMQLFWPRQRSSDHVLLLAFLAEVIVIELMRFQTEAAGFYVNPGITAVVPVAVIALARPQVWDYLVFAALYFLIIVTGDILFPKQLGIRDSTEWLNEAILISISIFGGVFSELAMRRAWAASRLLDVSASHDAMTGLPNRSSFERHFDLMTKVAERDRGCMALALIDLDHFKLVNDTYGHLYGDGVLSEMGVLLGQFARRPTDLVARVGGEEFALLLYGCDAENARLRLTQLLDNIRELNIQHQQNPAGVVTASIGGVLVRPGATFSEAYHLADEQLYKAKQQGRDHLSFEG